MTTNRTGPMASSKPNFKIIILLLTLAISLPFGEEAGAARSAQDKYVDADAAYQRLIKSPKKQRYRDQWLLCIDKFKVVYRHDSKGPCGTVHDSHPGSINLADGCDFC